MGMTMNVRDDALAAAIRCRMKALKLPLKDLPHQGADHPSPVGKPSDVARMFLGQHLDQLNASSARPVCTPVGKNFHGRHIETVGVFCRL
jgi:hypothetical protein